MNLPPQARPLRGSDAPAKVVSSHIEIAEVGPRIPMYTQEFAGDPHAVYREMREKYRSPLVPVWIAPDVPATLVIDYQTAVSILNDPDHFSADPRRWQTGVPSGCPILPMMEWRPNALRADGDSNAHRRYRGATTDALAGVNLSVLRTSVEKTANSLIATFCAEDSVDLMAAYIAPLPFIVLNEMVGCPPEIGERIAAASMELFDSQADAAEVNAKLDRALQDLIELKKRRPADDVTTRLVRHPNELTDVEIIHALVTIYSAGSEIPQNLISSTLLEILTVPKYRGRDGSRPPSTESAINRILAEDPPLANYCITYPKQPIVVGRVWLPPDEPIITSIAACSSSPKLHGGDHYSGGWHLAWGLGPHACPEVARRASRLITIDAIDIVLDALPDMELAVSAAELDWRPGPFHRALASFPVVYPPDPSLKTM